LNSQLESERRKEIDALKTRYEKIIEELKREVEKAGVNAEQSARN